MLPSIFIIQAAFIQVMKDANGNNRNRLKRFD